MLIFFTLLFVSPNIYADSITDELPSATGTYLTQTVDSVDDCQSLCEADTLRCRGSKTLIITYSDKPQKEFICHLYDGLSAGSAFEIKPPKPLIVSIAVRDLNLYRAQFGLGPVTLSTKLTTASDFHALDMAKNQLSHTGSDGSSPGERAQRHDYNYLTIGENVAGGQDSWESVFKGWQDSPGHNANLLLQGANDFGIAVRFDPQSHYKTYWAMLIGAELN